MANSYYDPGLVARLKAAMAEGISHKRLSNLTGIPIDTIAGWHRGSAAHRKTIEPDPNVRQAIRKAILEGA